MWTFADKFEILDHSLINQSIYCQLDIHLNSCNTAMSIQKWIPDYFQVMQWGTLLFGFTVIFLQFIRWRLTDEKERSP